MVRMEYWTEVVTENSAATWFKVDGEYFVVAVDIGSLSESEYRTVVKYLEDRRWTKQLIEDLKDDDIGLRPDYARCLEWETA